MVNDKILVLSAIDIAVESGRTSDMLVTRRAGRAFLERLDKRLAGVSSRCCMILEFSGVSMMDASFADEVFGELTIDRSRRKSENPRCLFLKGLDETSLENLSMALKSRPARETGSVRNSVVPVIQPDGKVDLIGKCENHVQQTFDLLRRQGTLTTNKVMDELKVNLAAASTRLKSLYDLGLVIREEVHDERGMQYRYTWPL